MRIPSGSCGSHQPWAKPNAGLFFNSSLEKLTSPFFPLVDNQARAGVYRLSHCEQQQIGVRICPRHEADVDAPLCRMAVEVENSKPWRHAGPQRVIRAVFIVNPDSTIPRADGNRLG